MSVEPHESPPRLLAFGEGGKTPVSSVHGSARSANRRPGRSSLVPFVILLINDTLVPRLNYSSSLLLLSMGTKRGSSRRGARRKRAFYTATHIFIQIIAPIEHTLALPDDETVRGDEMRCRNASRGWETICIRVGARAWRRSCAP